MPLETADYINELDENNPTFNDPVGRGDDHERLIKHVLKTSFPQFTGAVTLSQTEINELPQDIVVAVDAAVESLEPHIVPAGIISMWSGTNANIPTGWQICDGTNGTPDLRDRFIVGSGATYTTGNSGGSINKTSSNTTVSVSVSVGSTSLSVPRNGWGTTGGAPGTITSGSLVVGSGSPEVSETLESLRRAGGDRSLGSHTHSGSGSSSAHNHTTDVRPPYYALAYIMKLSTFA